MIKKTRTKVLALIMTMIILVVAITGIAMADTTNTSIIFLGSDDGTMILYPPGPEFPEDLHSIRSLDFHTNDIAVTTQAYQSWDPTDEDRQSAIGLPMLITRNFSVSVMLGSFYLEDTVVNEGAVLELFAGGRYLAGTEHTWQIWNQLLPATVVLFPGASPNTMIAGSQTGIVVAEGTNFTEEVPHLWAANLAGALEVFAGTARPGRAQAEMIWSVTPL